MKIATLSVVICKTSRESTSIMSLRSSFVHKQVLISIIRLFVRFWSNWESREVILNANSYLNLCQLWRLSNRLKKLYRRRPREKWHMIGVRGCPRISVKIPWTNWAMSLRLFASLRRYWVKWGAVADLKENQGVKAYWKRTWAQAHWSYTVDRHNQWKKAR